MLTFVLYQYCIGHIASLLRKTSEAPKYFRQVGTRVELPTFHKLAGQLPQMEEFDVPDRI